MDRRVDCTGGASLSLPNPVVLEYTFRRLGILDLLAASQVSRQWRIVADRSSYFLFRKAVFDRYYRCRTFQTNIPDSWWPLAEDDVPQRTTRRSWPPAQDCGKPGGPVDVLGNLTEYDARFILQKPHPIRSSSSVVLQP
ncbi:hypothetical protein HK405_014200, partial [Cladochytrium tenue]